MKKNYLLVMALCFFLLPSCKQNEETIEDAEPELIVISKNQAMSEGMGIGKPHTRGFSNYLSFTGNVVPKPTGKAQVSLILPGIVHAVFCEPGIKVAKGQKLFEVSGNALIDLQKEFAESKARLHNLMLEYERLKALSQDHVTTQQELTRSETAYLIEKANYQSLKMKLSNIGLETERISRGDFYSCYPVVAPIEGYISDMDLKLGQFIAPGHHVLEIIDQESLYLQLKVFDRDVEKLRPGMKVIFRRLGTDESYYAVLKQVSKSFDEIDKSVSCYAEIDNAQSIGLMSYQFVEGEVSIGVDSLIAVPESAILDMDVKLDLLRLVNQDQEYYYFEKISIKPVRQDQGYIGVSETYRSDSFLIKADLENLAE